MGVFSAETLRKSGFAKAAILILLTIALLTSLNLPAQNLPGKAQAKPTAQTQSDYNPVSRGDLVDIKVFNTPELSATARVNEKGEILLPVTGAVFVEGLTPDQMAIAIQKAIHDRQIMEDPRVTVLVAEYSTQMVTVAGEVKNPGVYSLVGRHDLYYVLSAAGGPTVNQGPSITITHKRDPTHLEIIPVNSPNFSVIEEQTIIYPGDIVLVSRAGVFYVVGEVPKSGAFYIQNGQTVTVLNALALAGSANFTASSRLSLIRKTEGKTELIPINVKEIAKAKRPDLALREGDIIFVPGSAWKRIAEGAIPNIATSLVNTTATAGILH